MGKRWQETIHSKVYKDRYRHIQLCRTERLAFSPGHDSMPNLCQVPQTGDILRILKESAIQLGSGPVFLSNCVDGPNDLDTPNARPNALKPLCTSPLVAFGVQGAGSNAPLSRTSSKKLTRSGSKLGKKASSKQITVDDADRLPGGWASSTVRLLTCRSCCNCWFLSCWLQPQMTSPQISLFVQSSKCRTGTSFWRRLEEYELLAKLIAGSLNGLARLIFAATIVKIQKPSNAGAS